MYIKNHFFLFGFYIADNLRRILSLFLIICVAKHAHAGDDRWEDIAKLSDIWATGKYLSPDIACAPAEWDNTFSKFAERIALGDASLDSARSALMFSSNSYFQRPPQKSYTYNLTKLPYRKNALTKVSDTVIARINGALTDDELGKWDSFINDSSSVVLDLRSYNRNGILDLVSRSAFFENGRYLQTIFAGNLPPIESITYHGYPTESGFSSGYFHSSLATSVTDQTVQISSPQNGAKKPLIIVLGNSNTFLPRAILAARLYGNAIFLSTDGPFQYGGIESTFQNSEQTEPGLLLARFKGFNLQKALNPDLIIEEKCASDDACLLRLIIEKQLSAPPNLEANNSCDSLPSNDRELLSSVQFPSSALRLYGIAKAYHVLTLFHPEKELLGKDLYNRYKIALKEASLAKTKGEYALAIARFIAPSQDPHMELIGMSFFEQIGLGDLPVKAVFLDNKVYVGCISSSVSELNVGDQIISVDGISVEQRISHLHNILLSSLNTSESLNNAKYIFRGEPGSNIEVKVKTVNGQFKVLSHPRVPLKQNNCTLPWEPASDIDIKWLNNRVAYINLSQTSPEKIRLAAEKLAKSKFLIVDLREYPQNNAWTLVEHLSFKESLHTSNFITPMVIGRQFDETQYRSPRAKITKEQWVRSGVSPKIEAKILVLINENTRSQGEHSVLLLKSGDNLITTIGSTTAGALGDATRIHLPGELVLQFTGQIVVSKDGLQVLGKGIKPDILIQNSLSEVLLQKDVVLDAAIRMTELE